MPSPKEITESLYSAKTAQTAPSSRRDGVTLKIPSALKPSDEPKMQENELIERLRAGDQRAFDNFFTAYSPKLFKIVYGILGQTADTEEVVQDVLLAVFQKAKTFRGKSQFSTWLYRLTVNAALARLRRRKRSREVLYDDYLPQFQKDGHHLVRPVVDWSDDVDKNYESRELGLLLNKAMDQLRPLDKAVVVLSDLEGLSDKEIAHSLGLSISAAKTRLHRARLFLRGRLAVHLGYSPT